MGEERRRSSFELPGRGAILIVFDGDAERNKTVAQPVGFRPIPDRPRLGAFVIGASLILILTLAVVALLKFSVRRQAHAPSLAPAQVMKLMRLPINGKVEAATISPDGKYVAYILSDAGQRSIWIRQTTATSRADRGTPDRAMLSVGHCRTTATECPAFLTICNCRLAKASPSHRICSTVDWPSTRTRCWRRHGRTVPTTNERCGKAWHNWRWGSRMFSAATPAARSRYFAAHPSV